MYSKYYRTGRWSDDSRTKQQALFCCVGWGSTDSYFIRPQRTQQNKNFVAFKAYIRSLIYDITRMLAFGPNPVE